MYLERYVTIATVMTDVRDDRTLRRRTILRQRAKRIRAGMRRNSKRDEIILIVLVITVIALIVGGATYFSNM